MAWVLKFDGVVKFSSGKDAVDVEWGKLSVDDKLSVGSLDIDGLKIL